MGGKAKCCNIHVHLSISPELWNLLSFLIHFLSHSCRSNFPSNPTMKNLHPSSWPMKYCYPPKKGNLCFLKNAHFFRDKVVIVYFWIGQMVSKNLNAIKMTPEDKALLGLNHAVRVQPTIELMVWCPRRPLKVLKYISHCGLIWREWWKFHHLDEKWDHVFFISLFASTLGVDITVYIYIYDIYV